MEENFKVLMQKKRVEEENQLIKRENQALRKIIIKKMDQANLNQIKSLSIKRTIPSKIQC